jgi:FkbM family methyltransferase
VVEGVAVMSPWQWSLFGWRPVYTLGLFYLRHVPGYWLKDYLRYGLVSYAPAHARFSNKDGIVFDLDLSETVQRSIYCLHYFEPRDAEMFKHLVQPGTVMLDVGANIGQYALITAKFGGKNARVYAFEPSPAVRQRLQHHLTINQASQVEVVAKAVGSAPGVAQFYPAAGEDNSGVGSLLPAESHRDDLRSQEGIEVEVTTLDIFVREQKLERVDMIKVDVEGFDFEALKGGEALLRNNPKVILMVELEDENLQQAGSSSAAIITYLAGFSLLPYVAEGGHLLPLEVQEHYYGINAFFLNPELHTGVPFA